MNMNTTKENVFKIKHRKPSFFNYEFCERVNRNKLATLILGNYVENTKQPWLNNKTQLHILTKMYISSTNNDETGNFIDEEGFFKTNYIHSKNTKSVGRVYAKDFLSLGTISKEYRSFIASEYYYDIDLENAHNTLIVNICRLENIRVSHIEHYNNNREKILKSVMKHHGVARDEAKSLFIHLQYGRKYDNWIKEYKCNNKKPLNQVLNFIKDVNKIKSKIIENNKDFIDHMIKLGKRDPETSCLAMFNQNIECRILECMFNFLIEKKLIKRISKHKSSPYHCVLCYDGIMIPKENCINKYKPKTICKLLREAIKDELNYDMRLTIKEPMNTNDLFSTDNIDFNKCDEKIFNIYCKLHNKPNYENYYSPQSLYDIDIAYGVYKTLKDDIIKTQDDEYLIWIDNERLWCKNNFYEIIYSFFTKQYYTFLEEKYKYLNIIPAIIEKKLKRLKNENVASSICNSIIKYIRRDNSIPIINVNKHDSQVHNLHFKNGVLELNNMTFDDYGKCNNFYNCFREYKREDYMTTFMDYNFNDIQEINNELFIEYENKIDLLFKRLQPQEAYRKLLINYIRYMITGEIDLEKFMIAYGPTASNGKSTIINLLKNIFTIYVGTLSKEYFEINYNKRHKDIFKSTNEPIRIYTIEEWSKNKLDTAHLKDIVSSKNIEIEVMYKTTTNFVNQSKIYITTNNEPNMELDQGISRRMMLTPFKSKFTKNHNEVDEDKHIYLADINLYRLFSDDIFRIVFINYLVRETPSYKQKIIDSNTLIQQNNSLIEDNELNNVKYLFEFTGNENDEISKEELFDMLLGVDDTISNMSKRYILKIYRGKLLSMGAIWNKDVRNKKNATKRGGFLGIKKSQQYLQDKDDYENSIEPI